MSSLLIGISFLLLLPSFISAENFNVTDYPNPQSPNPLKCGIDKPGWICDPDRPPILTKEERNGLMDLVEEFTESTKMVIQINPNILLLIYFLYFSVRLNWD
jgi:hypothetical protein